MPLEPTAAGAAMVPLRAFKVVLVLDLLSLPKILCNRPSMPSPPSFSVVASGWEEPAVSLLRWKSLLDMVAGAVKFERRTLRAMLPPGTSFSDRKV